MPTNRKMAHAIDDDDNDDVVVPVFTAATPPPPMAAPKQVPAPTKHPGGYPPHRSNPIVQHGEHAQHPTNGQCHTRRRQSRRHHHPNDMSNDTSSVRGTPTPIPTPTPAPIGAQGFTLTPPPTRQP